jgi:phosphoribosyl 1,2-cyclic phosphate phosphodiesterase
MIACDCPVCSSDDPRDQRTRASVVVEWEGRSLLVDTATELRLQARRANLRRVDAILFTHTHADHVCGLDDVRRFNDVQQASIPCFGARETLDNLRRQFSYVFVDTGHKGGGIPRLELVEIAANQPFDVLGLTVEPIPVLHGRTPVLGFRLGRLAYVTDCSEISAESRRLLAGLDVLVLDALRWRPHPTHFSIEEALAVVEEVRPRRTLFTHICHDLGHEATRHLLPSGVELAYDGLVVEVAT